MNKFMKITNLLSGLLLIRFSLSKLFAWPISVNAFIEMAKPIGIDPTFFRLFTGVIITTICLGYFYSFFILIRNKVKANTKEVIYATFFNLLGAGVMVGALISEFALRVEPKWPLVFIATFIVVSSVINFFTLKKIDNFNSLTLFTKSRE
jgi:hypothetical protein